MKKFHIVLIALLLYGVKGYSAWSEYSRPTTNASVTLSTITKRIRIIVDDVNSTNGTIRYSSATIYTMINNAQRMFCITTRALEAFATQQLTAGTTEYALPSNALYLERVTLDRFDGNGPEWIPQKTVWGLDVEMENWAIETSSPTSYYLRNQQIGMYPFPEFSGAELAIWYIRYPDDMTAESDFVFEGHTQVEPYWEALASYAAYSIFVMEGKLQLAGQYSQIWGQTLSLFSGTYRENPDRHENSTGTQYDEINRGRGNR